MNELNTEIIVTAGAILVVALIGGLIWLFALLGGYIKPRRAAALAGSDKMDVAYRFASELLQDAGVKVTPQRIKSSIQRAWMLLEGMSKRSGNKKDK